MTKMNPFDISKNKLQSDVPNMPVGVSSFEELIQNNYYYIDKTELIEDLIKSHNKVTLFTRPRRFGKTLAMRMLESFFNIEKDSKAVFEKLKISKNIDFCDIHMNKYPTIFITLKEVFGRDYAEAYSALKRKINNLYSDFSFLEHSDALSQEDKAVYSKLKGGITTEAEIFTALSTLIKLLFLHYGKSVILLVDEYDVPLAKAADGGYYDEMLNAMRIFMQVFKDNDYLNFAVITGCLRISILCYGISFYKKRCFVKVL